ncbi:Zinc ion binding, partial [Blomia tropicalis]
IGFAHPRRDPRQVAMTKCKSIKRLFPATISWSLLIGATSLFFVFPCQRLHEEFHYSITIVQAVITFFVLSNFFCTTFLDPGIIKRANPDEDKDDFGAPLYKEVQVQGTFIRMKWCATCQFYRPPRCSHCSVCDNCIDTFDHHCPWVNNCIGRRNYRHFFFFLIFLTIHMITIFIWCLLLALKNKNNLHDVPVLIGLVIMGLIVLIFFPVLGLTIFHIVLVARGLTTNEQVTHKFEQGAMNPFSRGIIRNCLYTLCGPRYPGIHEISLQKENVPLNDDDCVNVYMDNIPMDVQRTKKRESTFADIAMEPLEPRNVDIVSHPLERLNQKISPNNENQNVSTDFGSAHNGLKRNEGRHLVTMHQTENGTTETTFIALSSSYAGNSAKMIPDRPGMFFYPNNKISASPSKSTSVNEISSHFKHSPIKRNEPQHGPEGGMVIYYSPDAGFISNSKYRSETELQKFAGSTPSIANHEIAVTSSDFGYDSRDNCQIREKRPMPFLKALEMSNKMEKGNLFTNEQTKPLTTKETDNRQSQYEMNYEISV